MAEHSFQEVMREWVRSRKAINENKLSNCPLEMFTDDYIANIEKEVMAWSAEHPVVYPTWEEWLITQGVIKENQNGGIGYPMPKLLEPIPDDIAEKLGIKQKEG